MRPFFPPTKEMPSARSSLKRALYLSVLLVILWIAIGLLPSPEESANAAPPILTEHLPESAGLEEDAAQASLTKPTVLAQETSLIRPGYIFVVLLLAGGGLLALWLKQKPAVSGKSGGLREIGRMRTDQQQLLQLITCADEVLLVGTSANGVSLLKAYPASLFPAAAPTPDFSEADHLPEVVPSSPASTEFDPALMDPELEEPEWTVASASAIGDGPDFLTVLRRYAGRKTYQANTLYPPNSANPNA